MLDPDARHPEAGRGRLRGRGTAWSAFAGLALAMVLGGLFWVAVWNALRPATVIGTGATPELAVVAQRADDGDDALVEAADTAVVAPESPPVAAVEDATDEPNEHAVAATIFDAPETPATDAVAGPAHTAVPEEPGPDEASAAEATGEQDAEATEPAPDKAQELTARLEEVTARIEALTARLEDPRATATAQPTSVPVPFATPTRPAASARAPWVLLPHPEPGSRVAAGPLVVETRARGEAPITQVRLLLNGVALPLSLERRDDTTWRARAAARVGPGAHAVAVSVVDAQGRTGSYRWQFDAGSP